VNKVLSNKEQLRLLVLSGIFATVAIWWSPDLFTLNKFYNPGDILYPFNIGGGILDRIDPWDYSGYLAFGKNENYSSLSYASYYILLKLINIFGLEASILNRIYNLLSTFLVGVSIANLILKSVNINYKLKPIFLICTIYFVSSLPLTTLDPILQISWACSIYLISIFYHSIYGRINKLQIILSGLCLSFLTVSPRIVFLIIIFYLFNLIIYRNNIKRIISVLKDIALLALPIYVITISPAILSKMQSLPFEMISPDILNSRINVMEQYQNSTSLSRSILQVYMHEYSWYGKLFSKLSVITAASILILPIIYLLIRSEENKTNGEKFAVKNMILFVVIATMFGSKLHNYFIQLIPGLWILNTPQYILSFISIFFTVTLIIGINKILEESKNINYILVIILLIISVISVNRVMLINRIDSGKIEMGQHGNYFTIPDYVNDVFKITGCNYEKALVIPNSSNGYYTYKQWKSTGMPIVYTSFYCINTFSVSDEAIGTIKKRYPEIANKFENLEIEDLKEMGVRFVIYQKDVLENEDQNKKSIYNKIYKNLIKTPNILKYSSNEVEVYDLYPVEPYINIYKNGKEYRREITSALKYNFIIDLEGPGKYTFKTKILKGSPWDIYINNSEKSNISIIDEYKMLLKNFELNTSNNDYIEWEVLANNKGYAYIYNKNNIISYKKIVLIILVLYYLIIGLIIINKKNE
jgi:hypothetical protein